MEGSVVATAPFGRAVMRQRWRQRFSGRAARREELAVGTVGTQRMAEDTCSSLTRFDSVLNWRDLV